MEGHGKSWEEKLFVMVVEKEIIRLASVRTGIGLKAVLSCGRFRTNQAACPLRFP